MIFVLHKHYDYKHYGIFFVFIFMFSRRSLTNTLRIPQELIFPEPAVKLHASSDSDATPVGGGSPANHSPNNSLNARPNYSTAVSGTVNNKISAFIEPKSLQSALVSLNSDVNLPTEISHNTNID